MKDQLIKPGKNYRLYREFYQHPHKDLVSVSSYSGCLVNADELRQYFRLGPWTIATFLLEVVEDESNEFFWIYVSPTEQTVSKELDNKSLLFMLRATERS